MSDRLEMRISGLDGLIRDLDSLPQKLARKAVTTGLRRGANEFKRAAKRAAPRRTEGGPVRLGSRTLSTRGPGYLRRKGIISRKQRARSGRVAYRVGIHGGAFYGYIYEVGSKRGQPARPWFGPSWNAERRRVLAVTIREMRKAAQVEVAKHGR